MAEKLHPHLFRSDVAGDHRCLNAPAFGITRLLFKLPNKVFVLVAGEWLTVLATNQAAAEEQVKILSKQFLKPAEDKPHFHILRVFCGSVDTHRVDLNEHVQMNPADLQLLYGGDVPTWEAGFTKALRSSAHGISIFRGEPGTGKTTYIRSLLGRLQQTHKFLYLAADQTEVVTHPRFVGFWIEQQHDPLRRRPVVVVEDAEGILADRCGASTGDLANFLNIGDGFAGDFLKLLIIATLNIPIKRFDAALTRPGRLLAYREFRRLSRKEAQTLADSKGLRLQEALDYSLAEIFNPGCKFHHDFTSPKFGFAA
jgi:hypothetical protein